MTDQSVLSQIARELYQASKSGKPIEQISSRFPALTIDDAYKIQKINIDRLVSEGIIITGKKIGLTSLAMQQSLGVNQPDFGFLYHTMEVKGNSISRNAIMQPRMEGELAFILSNSLSGDVTIDEVIQATAYVVPAMEIVGTRIRDWKLTIIDTVADNASCGMYLLGEQRINPREVDLQKIPMTLSQNGKEINSGYGSAVLGHPAQAVAWLSHCMGQYGVCLNRGDIVLSGAFTAAVTAQPGDVFVCDYDKYGVLTAKFE